MMDMQNSERIRQLQLAFIGRQLAGVSHEFKNHLAIIRESSGLLEDLLTIGEAPAATDTGRYGKILAGIAERVSLAAVMCRHLSGFAHRMDQSLSTFDVADVLQEEIFFLQRFARQKQVELLTDADKNLVPVFNDPALLQFAIFCLVWPGLEVLEANGKIIAAATRNDSSVAIVIREEGLRNRPMDDSPWRRVLPDVLQILEAERVSRIDTETVQEHAILLSSVANPVDKSI
jgi:C4-dicarboxylate-specific signal transduction histidine kinase